MKLLLKLSMLIPLAAASMTTTVRPWGKDTLRVQICAGPCSDDLPSALNGDPPPAGNDDAWATHAPGPSRTSRLPITNGNLRYDTTASGEMRFTRVDDEAVLLQQTGPLVVPTAATGASISFAYTATTLHGMYGYCICPPHPRPSCCSLLLP